MEDLDFGPPVWLSVDGGALNTGAQSQAPDLLSQSTVSKSQDSWSGWLQNIVGTTASYLLQKDARQSGMTLTTAPNGQPIYTQASPVTVSSGPGAISPAGLLIMGAAVVGALLLVARKG